MDLDAVVQEKLDKDADFQASLADLSDEDRDTKIAEKRAELVKSEWSALSEAKTKAEQIAEDQRKRAEKAERAGKEAKPKDGDAEPPKPADDVLSSKDLYALGQAQVHPDDVDAVAEAAKVLKISVADALKNDLVKGILEKRVATRKTAEATNIRPARGAAPKRTDAEIVSEAMSGKIPDAGTSEAEDLFYARRGGKR